MATDTFVGLGGTSASGRFSGAVKRAFARMIAAREREARRYVAMHLAYMDPDTLSRQGWDQSAISALEKRPTYY